MTWGTLQRSADQQTVRGEAVACPWVSTKFVAVQPCLSPGSAGWHNRAPASVAPPPLSACGLLAAAAFCCHAAFGFGSVQCIMGAADKYKRSQRTAAGADKWLDMRLWDDTTACLTGLKAAGYQVVVTSLQQHSVTIQVCRQMGHGPGYGCVGSCSWWHQAAVVEAALPHPQHLPQADQCNKDWPGNCRCSHSVLGWL